MSAPARSIDERLAVYGLRKEQFTFQNLTLQGQTVNITNDPRSPEASHHEMAPKSIDDLKKWIGVNDRVAAMQGSGLNMRRIMSVIPPSLHLAPDFIRERILQLSAMPNFDINNASEVDRAIVRGAMKEYIYGVSQNLSGLRSIFNTVIRRVTMNMVLFQDVKISGNSVLTIGPDISILFANDIEIERGSRLAMISDNLNIDCASVKGV